MDIFTYAELGDGNAYFSTKLKSENWDEASINKRTKALIEATRLIDTLNFKGEKYNIDQVGLFPRLVNNDFIMDVPEAIKFACLEIAYALLDDTLDMELEIEALADTGTSFSSVRSDKNINIFHEHIKAGIPSSAAWRYLKPYLHDPRHIETSRG